MITRSTSYVDTEAVPFSLFGPRFLPGSSGSEGHLPPRGLPGRLRRELASACDPESSNDQSRSLGVFPEVQQQQNGALLVRSRNQALSTSRPWPALLGAYGWGRLQPSKSPFRPKKRVNLMFYRPFAWSTVMGSNHPYRNGARSRFSSRGRADEPQSRTGIHFGFATLCEILPRSSRGTLLIC